MLITRLKRFLEVNFKMSLQFPYSLVLNHKIKQTAPSFIGLWGVRKSLNAREKPAILK